MDNAIITVYAEQTPNPETLKFVVNQVISRGGTFDFPNVAEAQRSPLARALFGFDFVKGIFISSNYVTLTKTEDYKWVQIIPKVRLFLKEWLQDETNLAITDAMMEESPSFAPDDNDDDITKKIKEILANSVRPVVEMDGGAIDFKSFNEGKVTLSLRGSCSGCPSSAVTLKGGIESLLKRMIPEVTEVVAEAEE
ncbi:MAG: NifU family protein [Bacteroidetes bacterium]|nr:NifU family protein [Bacteroidota bacterium]